MTTPKRVLTLAQASAQYGVGRTHLIAEWHAHRLQLKDIGTGRRPALRVDVDEMERWWAAQPTAVPGKKKTA